MGSLFLQNLFNNESDEWIIELLVWFRRLFIFLIVATISWSSWQWLNGRHSNTGGASTEFTAPIDQKSTLEPFESYASVLAHRNLFKPSQSRNHAITPSVRPTAPASVRAPVPRNPTLAELASDLKLIGVLDSETPQAVILNRKTNKTSYVAVGHRIDAIEVTAISGNRVSLKLNDQSIDLSL